MIENTLNASQVCKKNGEQIKSVQTINYLIDREVLTQETIITRTGYEARDKSILYGIKEYWIGISFLAIFRNLVPIIHWLPKYSIRKNLPGDVIAGVTVAVMHIPQGMAYGILAGVTASVGLYMAFFPVLIYMLLGTSRHISIGTFAVISMMTLKVVQTYATVDHTVENSTETNYTPMNVVTATAIMVGILHLIMGLLRLGTLASLLSEPLVNGFTTAAACHVVVSQIKDILGVSITKHKGAFKILYTIIDLGDSVEKSNVASVIFSIGIILFMIIMNEYLKPLLAKKCRFPLPAELIAVVGGTLIARYGELNYKYNVKYVGHIPLGLPKPELPPVELLSMVAVDSIAIAIVSYSVVMSMALTFAKKHSYEISANQELFALGIGNIIGGFFSCIPMACSLSRSLIQEQTGGITQLASAVSALLILIVLLWIGPFFETLPRCVLAGIIVVALKGMFTQATQLKKFSKQGKLELLTWICTFVGVVLIDIDYGLFLGICVSFLALHIKGWKSYCALLGTIPETGIYVDLNNHKNATEIPHIKIFRYIGSINFASKASYKRNLYNAIEIDHQKLRRASLANDLNGGDKLINHYHSLILDLSTVSHIDVAGCNLLTDILKEMKLFHVNLYLANPLDRVYDTLIHSMALGEGPFEILPTVHDAVLYAKVNQIL